MWKWQIPHKCKKLSFSSICNICICNNYLHFNTKTSTTNNKEKTSQGSLSLNTFFSRNMYNLIVISVINKFCRFHSSPQLPFAYFFSFISKDSNRMLVDPFPQFSVAFFLPAMEMHYDMSCGWIAIDWASSFLPTFHQLLVVCCCENVSNVTRQNEKITEQNEVIDDQKVRNKRV